MAPAVHRWRRVGLALLFVTAALGLCVAGEATYEDRWPYPTAESVVADYDQHVGQRTLLFGSVERVDGSTATVRIDGSDGAYLDLTVANVEASVEPGGAVQVTGTLQPGHHLRADDVVVINASPGAKLWKYAASLVGLLVFLGLFFRHWRVNPRALAVEGRDDG